MDMGHDLFKVHLKEMHSAVADRPVFKIAAFKRATIKRLPMPVHGAPGLMRHTEERRSSSSRSHRSSSRRKGGGGDGGDKGGVMGGHGGVLVPCTTLNWCREMGL